MACKRSSVRPRYSPLKRHCKSVLFLCTYIPESACHFKIDQTNILHNFNSETFCRATYNRRLTMLKDFMRWLLMNPISYYFVNIEAQHGKSSITDLGHNRNDLNEYKTE